MKYRALVDIYTYDSNGKNEYVIHKFTIFNIVKVCGKVVFTNLELVKPRHVWNAREVLPEGGIYGTVEEKHQVSIKLEILKNFCELISRD